jgi:tetratricopeptide (TPR) repeat protein
LGRRWHANGRLAEALAWLDAAVLMTSVEAVKAELLALTACAFMETAELERARETLTEARSLARRTQNPPLDAWLVATAVELATTSGGPVATHLGECERAVEVLRDTGDPARLADALVTLGKLRFWSGMQPADRETLDEALAVARQAGNHAAELLALEWLAISYIDLRAPTDVAIAEQERLLGLAKGAPRAEAGILAPLAWLYGYAGRFDDARRTITRSIEMYKTLGSFLEAGASTMNAGSIELLAGDPVAAEDVLRRGLDELAAADERSYRAAVTVYLAEAAHERGRYGEAVEHANAVRELGGLTPAEEVWTLAIVAKAEAHRGAIEHARRLLQQADAWAAADSTSIAPKRQGELLLSRGEVGQLAGDRSGAAAAYRSAHALYADRHAWPLAARAQRLLAEVERTPA